MHENRADPAVAGINLWIFEPTHFVKLRRRNLDLKIRTDLIDCVEVRTNRHQAPESLPLKHRPQSISNQDESSTERSNGGGGLDCACVPLLGPCMQGESKAKHLQ